MCDLEDYAIQIGVERGIKQGRREERENTKLDDIANLMKNLSLTVDEALRVLEVPDSEHAGYRAKLAAR